MQPNNKTWNAFTTYSQHSHGYSSMPGSWPFSVSSAWLLAASSVLALLLCSRSYFMADPITSALSKLGGTVHTIDSAIGGAYNKLAGVSEAMQDPKAIKNDSVSRIMQAIANNETGGVKTDPYSYRKFSGSTAAGDDIGKYQVTTGELKSWSKQFLGEEITPDEYQGDPTIQDAYMKAKVGHLMDTGATPAEILAMHRGGLTGYGDPAVRQKKLAARKEYADKGVAFMDSLGQTKPTTLAANE